jgi:hypothetical protein
MQRQCSNCNGEACGFCLCNLSAVPLCGTCFSEHYQTPAPVHILLPLDLDPAVMSCVKIGDFIEKNRRAAVLIGNIDKHAKLLAVQLDRHIEDLKRIEEELHEALRGKFKSLQEQARELIREETTKIGQLAREVAETAKKPIDASVSLPGEMILKGDSLDLFLGTKSSELRTTTSEVMKSFENLQGAALSSLEGQIRERLELNRLYYYQTSTKVLTAFDPLRDVAFTKEIAGTGNFIDGMGLCRFSEDTLMIAGGIWNNACGKINLKAKAYTATKPMVSTRAYHGMIKYADTVYSFGGQGQSGFYRTFEQYVSDAAGWTQGNMARDMYHVNAACVKDKIFLTDYVSTLIECFTPATSAFKSLSFPLPNASQYSALVYDSDILVVFRGTTVITLKVQSDENLQEESRTVNEVGTWQVWLAPVKLGNTHYFFNYSGRRVYSVEVRGVEAAVNAKVNYRSVKD